MIKAKLWLHKSGKGTVERVSYEIDRIIGPSIMKEIWEEKYLSDDENLKPSHEVTHTEERPQDSSTLLSCPTCGKQFVSKANVKRHELIHTGPQYFCTKCNKQLKSKEGLKLHERRHKKDEIEAGIEKTHSGNNLLITAEPILAIQDNGDNVLKEVSDEKYSSNNEKY